MAPVPGRGPSSAGPAHAHGRVARWAVGLGTTAAVMIAVAWAWYGLATAIWGDYRDVDSEGAIFGLLPFALLVSVVALPLAVLAEIKQDRWRLLWLPLTVAPVAIAANFLAEAVWS